MLNIAGINQYYGSSHTLRDISFELPASGCVTLLGRNGVGKTTLLKCLMGLLPVSRGSIIFDGADITNAPPYRRAALGMGYVPQGREIFPRLTVEENLEMGLASGRKGATRAVFGELFQLFPVLKSMLRRRGGDLSGGQQQQLAIARALTARPRLLILDEPTEGIQPSIIKEIEAAIRSLAARGDMTVLLVEQYYDFARGLSDHFVVLSRGEVVASGRGDEMEAKNVRSHLAV